MFYDTFAFLCKQKGLSPSKAAIEAEISKSLVTKWKNNGTEVPSPEVLMKLSRFFGVTPDYLLGINIQSQIDTLSYQISQLKKELRSADADRREDLETSLSILVESYEDLLFAQQMDNLAQNNNSPTEPRLSEGEAKLIELFRKVPEDKQQLVLQMIEAA